MVLGVGGSNPLIHPFVVVRVMTILQEHFWSLYLSSLQVVVQSAKDLDTCLFQVRVIGAYGL